jgi:predicted acylesterase/phospholipase RssA
MIKDLEPSAANRMPQISEIDDVVQHLQAAIQSMNQCRKEDRQDIGVLIGQETWNQHSAILLMNDNEVNSHELKAAFARRNAVRAEFGQKWAMCAYQDTGARQPEASKRAAQILTDCDDPFQSMDPETLGIAGALWKNRWQAEGQRRDLDFALNFYLKGANLANLSDYGYTSINAALLLDVKADEEKKASVGENQDLAFAESLNQQAQELRRKIVAKYGDSATKLCAAFPDDKKKTPDWWDYATVAEALFGLGQYNGAQDLLIKGKEATSPDAWMVRSTAKQLCVLACLRGYGNPETKKEDEALMQYALQKGLGVPGEAIRSALRGKVGLALSGGGFRASLYHIGVLARLAEVGALGRVEVLSCVSGGSIIGAFYYLKLQKLLEENSDEDIDTQDYVELVRQLQTDFLASIQKNIRVRIATNWFLNLKMLFSADYSRTIRTAELMDKFLFNEANCPRSSLRPPAEEKGRRFMTDLLMKPGGDKEFKPSSRKVEGNMYRENKVPVLVLNATTLNTCHQWQFTASWLGEPPEGASQQIDGNARLRRFYYNEKDAPPSCKSFPLSLAVAASAAVPGVFEPIALRNVYPDMTVRLADGGVYDNQGSATLVDQGCNVLLISDASGHQGQESEPKADILGNVLRSSSVSLARVRDAQFRELDARQESGLARGLMFIHLRKDLQPGDQNWTGCVDKKSQVMKLVEPPPELTSYNIRRDIQDKIARIRTDLDSFSEIEAYALMLSGYRMTTQALNSEDFGTTFTENRVEQWDFLQISDALEGKTNAKDVLLVDRVLTAASQVALKVWRLSPVLRVLGIVLAIALLAAVLALAIGLLPSMSWTFGARSVAIYVLLTIAAGIVGKKAVEAFNWRGTLQKIALGIALCTLGWIFANVHILIFDRLYLRIGKLSRRKPDARS